MEDAETPEGEEMGRQTGLSSPSAGMVTEHEPTVTFIPVTEDALSEPDRERANERLAALREELGL